MKRMPNALLETNGYVSRAMLKVGYGQGYAKNPHLLKRTNGWKEVMEPILERLKKARDQALARMEATVNEADYNAVSNASDKLVRNIQLLEGKATDRIETVSTLSDEELTALANNARNGEGGVSEEGASTEASPELR